jgi:RNA polymerase sigma factor (sigma-70 family)
VAARVMRHRGRKVGSRDDSFDDFYRTARRKITIKALLAYDNPHDVDEAVQDAFVYVLERWDRVSRLPDDERQWYVMRAVINYLHSGARRRKALSRVVEQLARRSARSFTHVEEAALAGEAVRAIRNLPQRQRVIAVMHLMDDVPLQEIASALGISASSARTHLSRARAALAVRLGDQDLDLGLRAGPA